ncbi:hypothetical protein AUL39_08285 [Tractidigestivibacter scatoligenes]|uniref:Uncharacterized protein n=1 Tax=Tractidigestivibacter scatoligenes TaxID=1299998 RepID=A0A100YV11_TRASO|nr:hypothetical protein AUL39_08285 [Tractidigestivibacter scatoligenes]
MSPTVIFASEANIYYFLSQPRLFALHPVAEHLLTRHSMAHKISRVEIGPWPSLPQKSPKPSNLAGRPTEQNSLSFNKLLSHPWEAGPSRALHVFRILEGCKAILISRLDMANM